MPRKPHIRNEEDHLFAQTIGSILSRQRNQLRMSLVHVCDRMPQGPSRLKKVTANCSFHPSTLCRIEQGKTQINMIDLHYLCKILGLEMVDVFKKLNAVLYGS